MNKKKLKAMAMGSELNASDVPANFGRRKSSNKKANPDKKKKRKQRNKSKKKNRK